ncbi:MAG TPA: hypothetical protein DCL54_14745 [Alphaproteobacteria bacterium]|nr:hypothetical protein [Alphaproteobacteria bacterium]HAJ47829.1 hypothetical protein [Alphaproteobacteria bacterium]
MALPAPPTGEMTPYLSAEDARQIITGAIRSHFARVRARVPAFVEQNYALLPALRLNAKGIGRDMLRAPLNAALVLPHFGLRLSAMGFAKAGRHETANWLRSRPLFLRTDVAREVEWRIWTQLLQLPYRDGARVSTHDALAQAILAAPELRDRLDTAEAAYRQSASAAAMEARLASNFRSYGESRAAAAEVASATACLSAGAALLGKFTPSVLTLGPALAELLAAKVATGNGGLLTAVWLGLVPAKAGAVATVAVSAATLAAVAAATAVSGAVTDPVQKALGLHQRRLIAMIDAIERSMLGDSEAVFVARDHYAGRLIDLVDALTAAWRLLPR